MDDLLEGAHGLRKVASEGETADHRQNDVAAEKRPPPPFGCVPTRAADGRVGARALRVLIAIAAHANEQRQAWPGQTKIAKLTGIDRRGVGREIAALVSAGLIRVEHRYDEAGDRDASIYTIVLDEGVSSVETTPMGEGVVSCDDTVSPLEMTGVSSVETHKQTILTDQRTDTPRASIDWFFEEFWKAYPSKDPHENPKEPARRQFSALVGSGIDPALLVRRAGGFRSATQHSGTAPKFIPQAVNWLRDKRYLDHRESGEALAAEDAEARQWRARVEGFRRSGYWQSEWGDKPVRGDRNAA